MRVLAVVLRVLACVLLLPFALTVLLVQFLIMSFVRAVDLFRMEFGDH